MAFLRDFFKKLKSNDIKGKKSYSYLNESNPMEIWNVEGEIGDGAFGKVYKAKKCNEQTIAALKQVNLEEEGDLEEYMVEIEILTECKHSNIVDLYAAYNFESKLWMALEFCNGGAIDSLMEHLDKNLDEKTIKYVAKEVLSGLVFLHSHNVIHRDMKAGNVLLTQNADVKLADFGVSAKLTTDRQKRNTVQGTPYWMAPEVIACQNMETYYDCRVDIWSFGITLIEFAQMRPPYHQMQPSRVLIRIAKADPPILDKPRIWSKEFNEFLKICLTKNPDQRPYGAELLKDIFIESCDESNKKALKVLIHEAKAENIEETVEELDLKDVRNSVIPMETLDDISKFSGDDNDDMSLDSIEPQPTSHFSDENLKSKHSNIVDILNDIIMEQLKSEEDKLSILGVVYDAMQEHNPRTNIDDTVAELTCDNRTTRRDSIRKAMDNVAMEISDDEVIKESEKNEKVDDKSPDNEKEDTFSNNINRKKSCYKTMTKTRKFVVDGEEITTTTKKVVREGLENKSQEQLQERKLEIRELKILAKEESRQKRQLLFKIKVESEALCNKHKMDEQNFERNFENDMELICRSNKSKLEKLESVNYNEIKNNQKKLLAEKTKSENEFKAKDKSELNKELDKVSKIQRKDTIKKIREKHNLLFQEKFKQHQDQLDKDIEIKIESLTKSNRKKMQELESLFTIENYNKIKKHRKERARMAIEQCQALYQLETQHNKDLFMLRRQQVKYRQEKEMEHLEKNNKKELEYLDNIQQNERRSFPRFVKNVSKTRSIQKKSELQIQLDRNLITQNEMKVKFKEFTENDKVRENTDLKRMEQKLIQRRDAMLKEHAQKCREYDQIHAEQKKELTDQENTFMKEVEKRHKDDVSLLNKSFEEREIIDEEEFKVRDSKLKTFYNVDEESNGFITSYTTKIINNDGDNGVEHLC